MLLSLHTGLRIGEVCALRWEDIDLKAGVLHVRHTVSRIRNNTTSQNAKTMLIIDTPKTDSSKREIPLSSRLLPYIKTIGHGKACGYVLTDSHSFLSPRTYEYRFHKLLEESEMESFNYHVLRHTFATRCIEAGMDVKTLSEILGHANVSITLNTYVHSSMEMKRRQIEKLNKILL